MCAPFPEDPVQHPSDEESPFRWVLNAVFKHVLAWGIFGYPMSQHVGFRLPNGRFQQEC